MQALACFIVSLACVSKWIRKGRREGGPGPSVAQCPKLPTLWKCALSSWLWLAEMRNEYQSYIVVLNGRCLVAHPLVSRGDVWTSV